MFLIQEDEEFFKKLKGGDIRWPRRKFLLWQPPSIIFLSANFPISRSLRPYLSEN